MRQHPNTRETCHAYRDAGHPVAPALLPHFLPRNIAGALLEVKGDERLESTHAWRREQSLVSPLERVRQVLKENDLVYVYVYEHVYVYVYVSCTTRAAMAGPQRGRSGGK